MRVKASGALTRSAIGGQQLETEEDFLAVREVADDTPEWRRQLLDEGRRRENSLIFGDLWMLQDVDDLEIVLGAEVRFANPPKVRHRHLRARRRTRHIEFENVLGQNDSLRLNGSLSFQREPETALGFIRATEAAPSRFRTARTGHGVCNWRAATATRVHVHS